MNPKPTASPKRRKAEKPIGGPDDPLLAKARALTTAADTMEFPDFGDMFGGKYGGLAGPSGTTSPPRAASTRPRGGTSPSRVAHSPISSREAPGVGDQDAAIPRPQAMASPTTSPDRTRGPSPPAQPKRRRATQRKWAAATTKPIAVPEGTTLADAAAAAQDAAQDAARALKNGNALVAGRTARQGADRAPPRPARRPVSGAEARAAPAPARQTPAPPPSDYDRRIQQRIAAKKREEEKRRKAEEEAEERKRALRARDEERAAAYRARLARRVQEGEEKRRQRERAQQREAAERKRREKVEEEERAQRAEASRRAAAQRAARQWAEKHGAEERRAAEAELKKQLRNAKNAEEGSAAAREARRRCVRGACMCVHGSRLRLC